MTAPTPHQGPPLLMCPALSQGPPATKAVVRRCSICDTKVWVSWAMAPVVDTGDAPPCCPRCVSSQIAAGAHITPIQHPRQRALGQSQAAFTDRATRILARLPEPPPRS